MVLNTNGFTLTRLSWYIILLCATEVLFVIERGDAQASLDSTYCVRIIVHTYATDKLLCTCAVILLIENTNTLSVGYRSSLNLV